MKNLHILSCLIATTACTSAFGGTWTGTSQDGDSSTYLWEDTANWSTVLVPTLSTDALLVGGVTNSTIDLTAYSSGATIKRVKNITVSDGGSSSAFTLTGDFYSLKIYGSITSTSTLDFTITTESTGNVNFANDASVSANGSGSIIFDSVNVSITSGKTLTFDGTGTVTVDSTISGSGSIVQSGSGLTYLNLANSYTGGTTISAGTLSIGTSNSLGTGNLTLSGGMLDINFTGALGNEVVLTDSTTSIILANAGTHTLSGALSGSGSLTKIGSGSLVLDSGNASNSGTIVIGNGSLILGSAGSIGSSSSVIVYGSSATFEAGANAQELQTLTVTEGAATISGGTLTVDDGYFTVDSDAAFSGYGTVNAIVAGSGTVTATGNLTLGSDSLSGALNTFSGTLNVGSNTVTIKGNNTNTIVATAVTLSGGTLTGSNDFTFSGSVSGYGTISRAATLSDSNLISVKSGQTLTFANGLNGNGYSLTSDDSLAGTIRINGTYNVSSSAITDSIAVGNLDLVNANVVMSIGSSTTTSGIFSISSGCAVNLTGTTLTVTLDNSLTTGSWQIFSDYDLVSGSFDTVSITYTNSGYEASYADNILSIAAVPEPSTFALLGGLGVLGYVIARRKSQKA
jgi:fibronectin-binding autotransporter adhesin